MILALLCLVLASASLIFWAVRFAERHRKPRKVGMCLAPRSMPGDVVEFYQGPFWIQARIVRVEANGLRVYTIVRCEMRKAKK